jgi:8-oxo-dGTP pyrophosphatase MutT (NUDIX family)
MEQESSRNDHGKEHVEMASDENSVKVIQAAGGLLWRDSARGEEIAVIHRWRYGDWTLPKGKLDEGELWHEAALREVEEETGCKALLGSFAGSVSYTVKDNPKVVLFWNMDLVGECDFQPSEEVREVVWMSPEDALGKLDYPGERGLLMDSYVPSPRRPWLFRRFHEIWPSATRKRLARAIVCYRTELKHLIQRTQARATSATAPPWAKAALNLLVKAQHALDDNDIDCGWRCFNAAQRMELFGLAESNPSALQARAQTILREASAKAPDWRKQAIEDLLGTEGQVKGDVSVTEVFYAHQVLYDHYDNLYHKLAAIRRQLQLLGVSALLALLTTIVRVANGLPLAGDAVNTEDPQFVVSVALFGLMGASLSGIFSLAGGSMRARIPERLLNWWISVSRLVTGAVAALVVYNFLISGLLQIGGETTSGLILAVSFAAGFSERLVVRAVESVTV